MKKLALFFCIFLNCFAQFEKYYLLDEKNKVTFDYMGLCNEVNKKAKLWVGFDGIYLETEEKSNEEITFFGFETKSKNIFNAEKNGTIVTFSKKDTIKLIKLIEENTTIYAKTKSGLLIFKTKGFNELKDGIYWGGL